MLAESVIYNDSGPETVDMVPDTAVFPAEVLWWLCHHSIKPYLFYPAVFFVTPKGWATQFLRVG